MVKKNGKKGYAQKAGLPPGSLVYTGAPREGGVKLTVIRYKEDKFEEFELKSSNEVGTPPPNDGQTWINIDGVHQSEIIQTIGNSFNLHPLTQEDILSTDQRPKVEDMGHYLYIVLKMIHYSDKHQIVSEQVSIILGNHFLLSFQEEQVIGDVFGSVRERLRNDKSRLRRVGMDYLAYSLLDAVVDNYYIVLEDIGERVGALESAIINDPQHQHLRQLYELKRTTLNLRRACWPLREVISNLLKDDSHLIDESTKPYLQDVYGHSAQVIDNIEILRESLTSMLEVYLSSVNNRLNVTIKFLTLLATIFMPLTFIAGVYGMNFKYMPELEWSYGYTYALILMALVAISMLLFFRKRGWL